LNRTDKPSLLASLFNLQQKLCGVACAFEGLDFVEGRSTQKPSS